MIYIMLKDIGYTVLGLFVVFGVGAAILAISVFFNITVSAVIILSMLSVVGIAAVCVWVKSVKERAKK